MPKFMICEECWCIMTELAHAQKAAMKEAQERAKSMPVPVNVWLRNLTESDWNEIAEAYESSKLCQMRNRAIQHHLLTGHWVATVPLWAYNNGYLSL